MAPNLRAFYPAVLSGWLSGWRHSFRFSLRTVFIAITVTCVVLVLWGIPAAKRHRMDAAAAAIWDVGGRLDYVPGGLPVNAWLPHSASDAEVMQVCVLEGLQGLSLANTQVSDAGLLYLGGLTSLQVLDLENTEISDTGLAHLSRLTRLRTIRLRNTQVTDAGCERLLKALPMCDIIR